MNQPNLPKVQIINGSFEPIKLIEYNKEREFYFYLDTSLKETWLSNSIILDKRIVAEVQIGDGFCPIVGLTAELKEDGLYVRGENIRHLEDGEYSVGYSFIAKEDKWNIDLYERKISKGIIHGVSLIKD